MLENLSYPFLRPNVLDVKLGTLLYDEDASPEKRARMEKAARETTSGETGIRLTGFQVRPVSLAVFVLTNTVFQVYDLSTSTPIVYPKPYGRSLKPADLPSGMEHFFRLASDNNFFPSTLPPSHPCAPPKAGTGLPFNLLLPLLESLREDIAEIRAALADAPVRMVGASLLVIYEADWTRAGEGLRLLEELASRADNEPEQGVEYEDDEAEDPDDDESTAIALPYAVKLIDFAHTRTVPGGNADTGVLLGLDTFLRLLDGRIAQVRGVAPV